jgi:hypothetical protein
MVMQVCNNSQAVIYTAQVDPHYLKSHYCTRGEGTSTLSHKPLLHPRGRDVHIISQATTTPERKGRPHYLTSHYSTQGERTSTLFHKPLLHPRRRDVHTISQATTTPEGKGRPHYLTNHYCTRAERKFTLAHKPLLHPRGELSSSAYNTVHLSRGRGIHTICQVHTVLTSCVRHGQAAPQLRSKMNNRIYLCKFSASVVPNVSMKFHSFGVVT